MEWPSAERVFVDKKCAEVHQEQGYGVEITERSVPSITFRSKGFGRPEGQRSYREYYVDCPCHLIGLFLSLENQMSC